MVQDVIRWRNKFLSLPVNRVPKTKRSLVSRKPLHNMTNLTNSWTRLTILQRILLYASSTNRAQYSDINLIVTFLLTRFNRLQKKRIFKLVVVIWAMFSLNRNLDLFMWQQANKQTLIKMLCTIKNNRKIQSMM